MNRKFLEKAKERLIQRKKEILEDVSQGQSVFDRDESRARDIGDEALEISMEKLESSIKATEMDELKLIDKALKRIELGSYGVCVDCGGMIAEKRLEFFPFAARCIVCQEKLEE